jgi:hypothetical protein
MPPRSSALAPVVSEPFNVSGIGSGSGGSPMRWIAAAGVARLDDLRVASLTKWGGLKNVDRARRMAYGRGPTVLGCRSQDVFVFLHTPGRERVLLCILAVDALENAAQSSDLSGPALRRIFEAHRQMIELRAAQKLNAGLLDSNGSVQVVADDI